MVYNFNKDIPLDFSSVSSCLFLFLFLYLYCYLFLFLFLFLSHQCRISPALCTGLSLFPPPQCIRLGLAADRGPRREVRPTASPLDVTASLVTRMAMWPRQVMQTQWTPPLATASHHRSVSSHVTYVFCTYGCIYWPVARGVICVMVETLLLNSHAERLGNHTGSYKEILKVQSHNTAV